MSSVGNISQELLLTLEGIIRLVASGETVENVARKTNLDVPTIDGLMGREEFHTLFRELDPNAYQRWQDDQADLTAKRAVKNMARADAVKHYKLYRDYVTAPDSELKTNERLNHLWNLIKAGGVLDGQDTEERVTLSEGTMETMRSALQEMNEFFTKKR